MEGFEDIPAYALCHIKVTASRHLFQGAINRRIYRSGVNQFKLVDGVIVLGLGKDEKELVRLIQEDFSVVFVGHKEFPDVSTFYVAADYIKATAKIVEHILNKGHIPISYIGTKDRKEPGIERRLGYSQAVDGAGLGKDCKKTPWK